MTKDNNKVFDGVDCLYGAKMQEGYEQKRSEQKEILKPTTGLQDFIQEETKFREYISKDLESLFGYAGIPPEHTRLSVDGFREFSYPSYSAQKRVFFYMFAGKHRQYRTGQLLDKLKEIQEESLERWKNESFGGSDLYARGRKLTFAALWAYHQWCREKGETYDEELLTGGCDSQTDSRKIWRESQPKYGVDCSKVGDWSDWLRSIYPSVWLGKDSSRTRYQPPLDFKDRVSQIQTEVDDILERLAPFAGQVHKRRRSEGWWDWIKWKYDTLVGKKQY